MLVRNASPRRTMCFSCLMFNLSGPCGLLFLLCCIASCIVCVALLLYWFVLCVACLTVFVKLLVKQFAMCFGCGCYFVAEWYGCVLCGWWCAVG